MHNWYRSLFARMYDPIMQGIEQRKIRHWRKMLLSDIRGNTLEIGSGTGVNFPYYSTAVRLIASDPSPEMLQLARRKSPPQLDIQWVQGGVESEELDRSIAPESLDAIVSTLVLCTVSNPSLARDRFMKWLKPGGRVYLLEHIHALHPVNKQLQKWIDPLWTRIAEGCHLCRPTDQLFHHSKFQLIEERYYTHAVRWYQAVYSKPH